MKYLGIFSAFKQIAFYVQRYVCKTGSGKHFIFSLSLSKVSEKIRNLYFNLYPVNTKGVSPLTLGGY